MSQTSADASASSVSVGPASDPWDDPPRRSTTATSPILVVDGFAGPLDWLLELARRRKVDLARLSLLALTDAFGEAMRQALGQTPDRSTAELSRWAAWTVMAAQLAELRSRLLLPADAPEARVAQEEAEALRRRLIRREEIVAATDWLERQARLGRDVFARGRPESFHASRAAATADGQGGEDRDGAAGESAWEAPELHETLPVPGGDLTDLLRACLVALQLPAEAAAYQPRRLPFWSVGEAVARIARLLDAGPDGAELGAFLPTITGTGLDRELHCRAAVAATVVAGLELARAGVLALEQEAEWRPIRVHRAAPDGQGAGQPSRSVS